MLYIGLPQWSHPKWRQWGITSLEEYARYFNCVEGNTTLYAVPSAETVMRWRAMSHDDFSFCFKFPATISHQAALRDCASLTQAFLQRMEPLAERVAQYWLQLPAAFSPQDLPVLWAFLDRLPQGFNWGVEVRHPAFFEKGDIERALNQGLHARSVNRVILDSRPVHSAAASTPAMVEAQRKKPRLPVHAVLTGTMPLVRFIASDDMPQSAGLFHHWINRLSGWSEDHNPFLFLHTPDIGEVHQIVTMLLPVLQRLVPDFTPPPAQPEQPTLF